MKVRLRSQLLFFRKIARGGGGKIEIFVSKSIVLFFVRSGYCHLAAIVFATWVAVPFFASSRHFYCHAIFIAAIYFVAVQPDSNYCVFSFKAGPFFSWVAVFALVMSSPYSFCCSFVVTIGRCPVLFFFAFLVVLVIFTPSFCRHCSYSHCSTGSDSHTVVLSKPASYSPVLFSIPVKIREHAYQSFIVVYSTGKVRQLCGYSVLVGMVKVRLRYGRNTGCMHVSDDPA